MAVCPAAGFSVWISFASVLGFVCCWVLIFVLSPFLCFDLRVLGDGALISLGFFMRARYLCVLIHM